MRLSLQWTRAPINERPNRVLWAISNRTQPSARVTASPAACRSGWVDEGKSGPGFFENLLSGGKLQREYDRRQDEKGAAGQGRR